MKKEILNKDPKKIRRESCIQGWEKCPHREGKGRTQLDGLEDHHEGLYG